MNIYRILILEDDMQTQSILLRHIAELENELYHEGKLIQLATTVISEYTQVQEYINTTNHPFDIILCTISIVSVFELNESVVARIRNEVLGN